MTYSTKTEIELQRLSRMQRQARNEVPVGDIPIDEPEVSSRWIWFMLGCVFGAAVAAVLAVSSGADLPFCHSGQVPVSNPFASAQSLDDLVWRSEISPHVEPPIVQVCTMPRTA